MTQFSHLASYFSKELKFDIGDHCCILYSQILILLKKYYFHAGIVEKRVISGPCEEKSILLIHSRSDRRLCERDDCRL